METVARYQIPVAGLPERVFLCDVLKRMGKNHACTKSLIRQLVTGNRQPATNN
jgi:hypothetical protein